MKTVYLNNFMSSVVTELERNGQYSTAHVCGSVLRSVMTFDGDGLLLSSITPLWLKAYEHYLLHKGEKGLEWNTISTYMRMLRAVYNRAVVRKLVPFVPHLFREVFTGRKADHRRVLERDDMRQLLAEKDLDIISPGMEWARACLELMFRFHGMPFVDLAHLRKSDLKDGYLTLRRRKTGMPLSARVDSRAMQLLERYRNWDDTSPYLLCFLDGSLEGMAAYRDYLRILRLLNSKLRALALWRKVQGKVTSYTARHTWATAGKYCHIPIEIISEGLGHASVTTTEGYMKGFGNSRMERVNKVIMNYIFKG